MFLSYRTGSSSCSLKGCKLSFPQHTYSYSHWISFIHVYYYANCYLLWVTTKRQDLSHLTNILVSDYVCGPNGKIFFCQPVSIHADNVKLEKNQLLCHQIFDKNSSPSFLIYDTLLSRIKGNFIDKWFSWGMWNNFLHFRAVLDLKSY